MIYIIPATSLLQVTDDRSLEMLNQQFKMQLIQFGCFIWTFYFPNSQWEYGKYVSYVVLLTFMVIIPLTSITQYALSFKTDIFSDDSGIMPFLNTALLDETNFMKAWMATYPLQGLFNIIYYFVFLHQLTRLLSVQMMYQMKDMNKVFNIMNLTKQVGPISDLNDNERIYKTDETGSYIEFITWEKLKKIPIPVPKDPKQEETQPRDKGGKGVGGEKGGETDKTAEDAEKPTSVMDKDAFDNSDVCKKMHLNEAQMQLIDDLRSVQEKQLETQWIDRDHKVLNDAKPEEYGDAEVRYCCFNFGEGSEPFKVIEGEVFD